MDPISMTQAEAAMLESIKQNIVDPEVMGPMETLDWQHGAPPPPIPLVPAYNPQGIEQSQQEVRKPETVTADNPQVTPPADSTATPPAREIDWESLRQPNGLILGKYKSEAEATKGVAHAVEMAKTALAQKAELEAKLAQMSQPTPQYQLPPQQTSHEVIKSPRMVVDNTKLDTVLSKIVEEGGTLDQQNITDLREALLETSQQISAKTVEDVLLERDSRNRQENDEWTKVDNYMRSNYPDALNFTDEISVFVQTSPFVNTTVNALISSGHKAEAAEFAWKEYSRARDVEVTAARAADNQVKEITLSAADQVRREAVEQARKDAGVMTTIASGIHETPPSGASPSEIENAAAEMGMLGSAPGSPGGARWRALTIGKDLRGPLFD
jgi:hypothetical protein